MKTARVADRFSILTLNVWHGLAERGVVRFRAFEDDARRAERWASACRAIAATDADVICLQELNPLNEKLEEISATVGGSGAGRIDQGGVRLFAVGLPENLRTGLGMVIRREANADRVGEFRAPVALQLSGFPFVSGDRFSFHFSEIRVAQVQSILSTRLGRLLVVNTHLHHGFERFAGLRLLLQDYQSTGRLTAQTVDTLSAAMDRSRDRRLAEANRLLETVARVQRDYDGVLLAGDFNSTPEGAVLELFRQFGFGDLAVAALRPDAGPTWDPIGNAKNHQLQDSFQFPLPTLGIPAVQTLFRDFDRIPRRVDFVLGLGSPLFERPSQALRVGRMADGGVVPSDHYGVLIEWI